MNASPMSSSIVLSFALQAHPRRSTDAAALARSIGGPVDVAFDPEPDGPPNAWRGYRNALARTPAAATHRVVLQDDAVVCAGFREAVALVVAARPDRLICLTVCGNMTDGVPYLYAASDRGEHWAELPRYRWCPLVAVVWPAALARECVAYADSMFAHLWPQDFTADDEVVGRWLQHAGVQAVATVPCLVEHPDMVASLVGKQAWGGLDRSRVSACYIEDDCDARLIDWSA